VCAAYCSKEPSCASHVLRCLAKLPFPLVHEGSCRRVGVGLNDGDLDEPGDIIPVRWATSFQKALVNRESRSLYNFTNIPCIRHPWSTNNRATVSAALTLKLSGMRCTTLSGGEMSILPPPSVGRRDNRPLGQPLGCLVRNVCTTGTSTWVS